VMEGGDCWSGGEAVRVDGYSPHYVNNGEEVRDSVEVWRNGLVEDANGTVLLKVDSNINH
jgi:hypothetical protein